jgi:hypothetical protein
VPILKDWKATFFKVLAAIKPKNLNKISTMAKLCLRE